MTASKGGLVHLSSSTGTTSVWPKSVSGSASASPAGTVNAMDTLPGCGSKRWIFTASFTSAKNRSSVSALRCSSPESAVRSFTHALRMSSRRRAKVSS